MSVLTPESYHISGVLLLLTHDTGLQKKHFPFLMKLGAVAIIKNILIKCYGKPLVACRDCDKSLAEIG